MGVTHSGTVMSRMKARTGTMDTKDVGLLSSHILNNLELPITGNQSRLVLYDMLTKEEKTLLFLLEAEGDRLNEVLPSQAFSPKHRTCAIVGNSVTLLDADLGNEIDSNSAVLRFSDTKEFLLHTGKKRTYLALTEDYLETFLPSEDIQWKIRKPKTKNIIVYGDTPLQKYADMIRKNPDIPTYYLSPAFELEIQKFYRKFHDILVDLDEKLDPSFYRMPHALLPIFMMMRICDDVFVYGFSCPADKQDQVFYGRTKSNAEIVSNPAIQYILKILSLEGRLEFVN